MAETIDNRNLNSAEKDANLQEIINDDSPIEEDVSTEVNETEDSGNVEEATTSDNQETVTLDTAEAEAEPEAVIKPIPEEPTPEADPEPDYKEKFSASSREATTQYFKNKKLNDTIEDAKNLPDPTIEDLQDYARSQGSAYDDLDPFAQNILKQTYINERRFEMIYRTSAENKDLDKWADSLDEFSNSPETVAKYPSLSDYEVEFKKYAMKESRRGIDKDDLVASFLFQRQGDDPAPKAPKKKAEDMLLTGGGGGSEGAPKKRELTAEEVRVIRNTNPTRYKELVKEGKVGMGLLDSE